MTISNISVANMKGTILGMGLSQAQYLGVWSRRGGQNDHYLNVVPGESNISPLYKHSRDRMLNERCRQ